MSDTSPANTADHPDERIAYRSVFQRLLIRPEIGAVIAAVSIWVFFWAVSGKFGTTSGMQSVLDTASSPLGIMAVAVAMLMIGGEFDLSSGAATGALGIVVILMVRDVAGGAAGGNLSLWLALPLSLAVALGLGWFNGTMVNRTSLPSFIVTLGSFFVLKGAKLGFSKLIVEQIQVGKLDDLKLHAEQFGGSDKGYGALSKVFNAEWVRNDHIWGSRDAVYQAGVIVGLVIAAVAVYELHYRRVAERRPAGLIGLAVGAVGAVGGVVVLHRTDSVGGNTLGATLCGVSMLIGFIGLGWWRYERVAASGLVIPTQAWRLLGVGGVLAVAGVSFAQALDAENSENISWLYLVTHQGARAILYVGLSGAAAVFLLLAARHARRASTLGGSAVLATTGVFVACSAFFIRSESAAVKFRSEAFSVMLALAGIMVVWAITTSLFAGRSVADPHADHVGKRLSLAGAVLVVVGLTARLLWVTQDELDAGISRQVFSVRTLWFFGFTAVMTYVLGNTRFGSWTFAVGGNKQAARQVGVPAARTKTQLFMLVSAAAWLVGLLLAFRLNTIQASTGDGEEFEYIIAAVVGGTALTGGYGSTLGAAIGAFIMAMAYQGIPSSRWNSDWRWLFVGAILLLAVIANNFIRTKAEALRS